MWRRWRRRRAGAVRSDQQQHHRQQQHQRRLRPWRGPVVALRRVDRQFDDLRQRHHGRSCQRRGLECGEPAGADQLHHHRQPDRGRERRGRRLRRLWRLHRRRRRQRPQAHRQLDHHRQRRRERHLRLRRPGAFPVGGLLHQRHLGRERLRRRQHHRRDLQRAARPDRDQRPDLRALAHGGVRERRRAEGHRRRREVGQAARQPAAPRHRTRPAARRRTGRGRGTTTTCPASATSAPTSCRC